MKRHGRLVLKLREKQGATVIIVAILITTFLGFAALAVDLGYVMVTRNELQNIADSAALAATRELGHIYEPMSYSRAGCLCLRPGTSHRDCPGGCPEK